MLCDFKVYGCTSIFSGYVFKGRQFLGTSCLLPLRTKSSQNEAGLLLKEKICSGGTQFIREATMKMTELPSLKVYPLTICGLFWYLHLILSCVGQEIGKTYPNVLKYRDT